MTDVEQQEVERAIAAERPVEAPIDLRAEDVRVEKGNHQLPRRAA